jgi:hypothetical protein
VLSVCPSGRYRRMEWWSGAGVDAMFKVLSNISVASGQNNLKRVEGAWGGRWSAAGVFGCVPLVVCPSFLLVLFS